jgi:hypothetical protein
MFLALLGRESRASHVLGKALSLKYTPSLTKTTYKQKISYMKHSERSDMYEV